MKLKFDASQQYQLDAINSVVDVFEGQPLEGGDFELEVSAPKDQLQIDGSVLIGNNLLLGSDSIVENVHKVQDRFSLPLSESVSGIKLPTKLPASPSSNLKDGMNFSIEMETGTGKSYVYLRTIHELHQKYGFKKFVIVVPSIAIREGVLKNLEITQEHFSLLYDNPKVNFFVYDPKRRGQLRGFGTSNSLQIMVINIDSFTRKSSNIIYQDSDWGVPVEFVQGTRPIVIMDEPQNMETEKRKRAIENLNPLCTLRYSATHKNPYNLLYKLDPVQAYDKGLVKMIEVDSVFSDDAYNDAYIRVVDIKSNKSKITAKIEFDKSDEVGLQRKEVSMQPGDDLYDLSGGREVYKDGFVLESIDLESKEISFSNGKRFKVGQKNEQLQAEIMKYQIRKTVENHFEKERKFKDKGIKVLSLFFIDKVSNYRKYTDAGWEKGLFAQWFEEVYEELKQKPAYKDLVEGSAEEVHNGYFAQDKKSGSWKDSTSRETKADGETYELIMRDKERLLDTETPLRFIFSHSALREGWDNPNVFQICTLNETHSTMKKRQEIGRGLRLPVNQDGERIFDTNINVLTVVANESYEVFAKTLQSEIEEDCGVEFKGRIKDKKKRRKVKLRKGYELDDNFKDLWKQISQKTHYHVNYSSEELINAAVKTCSDITVSAPRITNVRVKLDISQEGVESRILRSGGQKADSSTPISIPDVITAIQRRTKVTKNTVFQILKQSGLLKSVLINPQHVADEVASTINATLTKLMVDGIKYEKVAGDFWEMQRFENDELEEYLDKLVKVQEQDKTLYDHVITDSSVEERFARDLESREDVKFYFKLPRWFKIDTPLGGYNPDWAILFENDHRIYFVAETKKTGEIRESEDMKIKCGRAHFGVLDGVRFERVEKLEELSVDSE